MNDPWTRESAKQAAAPLYGLAALGALGLLLGRSPDRGHRHFWALTIIGILVNAAIVAVCVYVLVDLVQYLLATTPCQRMGTC